MIEVVGIGPGGAPGRSHEAQLALAACTVKLIVVTCSGTKCSSCRFTRYTIQN